MPRVSDDVLGRVTRRGVRISRHGFTLYYLKLLNPPAPRIVISQKVDKRAVVRNRLRRRIRAIIQTRALTNRALVVITRKELIALTYPELKQQIGSALHQIQ